MRLNDNAVTTIEAGAFEGLSSLTVLYLGGMFCDDLNDGAADVYGDDCAAWTAYGWADSCGTTYDDDDFTVQDMCCECGGGLNVVKNVSTCQDVVSELPEGCQCY